jgi:hypothetical protein
MFGFESGDGFESVGMGCAVDFDDDEVAIGSDRKGFECLCGRRISDCGDDGSVWTFEVCFYEAFAES